MTYRSTIFLTALATLFGLVAGCPKEDDEQAWAGQASDSVDVAQSESALLMAATDGVDAAGSGDEAAAMAASQAERFYQPAGCVTATATGNTVVYELVDCTGPHGLVHVTGAVSVEYGISGDGIAYDATSRGLEVNGATMDIDSEGVYRRSGNRHELTTTMSGSGTGRRGHSFDRDGSYTATWDADTACLGLDGSWMTRVEGLQWTTTVSAFEKCVDSCPAAGGSIRWENARNSLTIRYDGSATVSWETGRGRTGTVNLWCE